MNFTASWSYLSPQTSPLPSIWSGTLHHSPSFSLLNTKIGNEFYCPCPFLSPALSSLSTILQLHIHIALIVSLLCSLKEGENQFYSTLSPIKWHTSDFSCFFPFYLFKKKKKKEGLKSIFWPLLPFYSPGHSPKQRHTSSFCSAALSESLTVY